MDATINVRMDKATKERGDAVLRQLHISTSDAVRSLWREMGRTRKAPDFIVKESAFEQDKERKKSALAALGASPKTAFSHMSDDELAQIYGAQYE